MKANELRIGNWVYAGNPKKTVKVETIGQLGINLYQAAEDVEARYEFEDLRPIPLKPEIIDGCLSLLSPSLADEVSDLVKETNMPLHRFQNLYFALTEKELITNP